MFDSKIEDVLNYDLGHEWETSSTNNKYWYATWWINKRAIADYKDLDISCEEMQIKNILE